MSISNILKCWDLTDEIDKREGATAYQKYHDMLYAIAKHYQVGFVQTVAAFAALSPNNDYMGNLRSLVTLIQGVKAGWDVDIITTSTYNACRDRAYLFLTGEQDFLISTKGPKTRAFYHNIINPYDPAHVTIDGHMYGVWVGKQFIMKDVAQLKIPYAKIEHGFKTVARWLGLIPNQLQATLWFTWKRHHNVVYNAQLGLYNSEDVWGLNIEPADIKPFPYNFIPELQDRPDLSRGVQPDLELFRRQQGLAKGQGYSL